jgi:putative hydrolase
MDDIDQADLIAALTEIPLFREIRNVLINQSRPVNWDIARQIASALAQAGPPDFGATSRDLADFQQACRIAELKVTALTGFELLPGITQVDMLSRSQWAQLNLDDLAPFMERLAIRLSGQVSDGPPVPVQAIVGAIGPFAMGTQLGLMVGYLAHKTLSHWDFCLPRTRTGRLYVNYPNLARVERELGVEPKQFRLWIGLHEVSHELIFQAVAWARPYFVGLIEAYIDAASIDPAEIMGRIRGLTDPDEVAMLMQQPEELFPMLRSPAQNEVVERIQSFMSVAEGYSEWIVREAGLELLNEFDKIREGINRRRAERSSAEKMLEKLLGLDLEREQHRAGERFISKVAHAGQLGLLWKGPENLPTMGEIAEPAKWLTRLAFS